MKNSSKILYYLTLWVIPILILALWIIASKKEWVHPYLLPSLNKIGKATLTLLTDGELLRHLWASLRRVLAGFAITSLIAFPLSIVIHFIPLFRTLFRIPLEFLRSIPPLATIPLLILWFGIGETSKIAVIVMASFFPLFLNILSSLDNVDKRWKDLSYSLQLHPTDYLTSVLLPASFPAILTGIQLAISYSWRALMGAEMIAAASGIGYLILDSQEMGRIDRVFVGIFILGSCGIFLDHVLLKIFNRLVPWKDLREERI